MWVEQGGAAPPRFQIRLREMQAWPWAAYDLMPTITYICEDCDEAQEIQNSIKISPPPSVKCPCGSYAYRHWKAPQFVCERADRPHDFVPPQFRVSDRVRPESAAEGRKIEKAYQEDLKHKRDNLKSSDFQMSHSIPAHLYHGKVRETGDRSYWLDPKNRAKHKSCEVKKRK